MGGGKRETERERVCEIYEIQAPWLLKQHVLPRIVCELCCVMFLR